MKVILTETVESVGLIGTEMNVADGYARNYLFPKNLAVAATAVNRKLVAGKRVKWDKKIAEQRAAAEQLAARLEQITCTIGARVSEDDRLYGSVTVRDIADALSAQGFEINKNLIRLDQPIKTLGPQKVAVRLFHDVVPKISVEVVAQK